MLNPGDRIGDWQIVLPLGQGGMGSVYRCRHALSSRIEAAVKVLNATGVYGARERFIREAEALHALRHPAIVRIAGFGEDAGTGLMWLAMELVHGEDVEHLLTRRAFPRDQVPDFFAPIAEGLAYAHARGIAHRDIKPANLMLQSDGLPVLLDFGIAVQEGQDRLTQDGVMPGTVAYAAPEQVLAGADSTPTLNDTYALGQVMYECLTSRFTYSRDASIPEQKRVMQILRAKMKAHPLDPGPEFSDHVRSLVRSATQPDPARRGPPLDEWRAILQAGPVLRGSTPARPPAAPRPAAPRPAAPRPLPAEHAAPMSEEIVRVRAFPPPSADARPTTVLDVPDDDLVFEEVPRRRRLGCAAVLAGMLITALVLLVGTLVVVGLLAGAMLWLQVEAPRPRPTLGEGIVPMEAVESDVVQQPVAPTPEPIVQPDKPRRAPTRKQPAVASTVRTQDPQGRLVISADAAAGVSVDGAFVKEVPVEVKLAPGPHSVAIVSEDGRRQAFNVYMEAGEIAKRAWSFEGGQWHSFEGGVNEAGLPLRPDVSGLQGRFDALGGPAVCLRETPIVRQRLRFTIVPDGSIVSEGLEKDGRSVAEACLNRAVRELRFAPSKAGAAVQVWVGP